MQEKENKCKIYKSVRKINLDGTYFDDKIVEVVGNTLDDVKKIFDKLWNKKRRRG